ncbi:MAG: DNA recombination protein RmuC [Pseudomonadota bacterium]
MNILLEFLPESILDNALPLIVFGVLAVLLYIIASLRMHLKLTVAENVSQKALIDTLSRDQIEHLRQIQDLTSQIEYLTKASNDQDRARKEAFDSAKASLVDLGGLLSKQLIEMHKQESQESRQMAEKNISTTTEKFHTEFEKLVVMVSALNKEVDQSKSTVDVIRRSLLSPAGAGKLAEITLENILKSSGLRSSLDFSMQHTLTGRGEEKFRPDAIIFLPSNNLMVIDAKASKFLCEMEGAADDDAKSALSSQLMKTMNSHLKSLISKEYADNTLSHYHLKSQHFSNVITLMFLPTESALEHISAVDPQFIQKAWSHNIFPVGPAGLMNMLSFAKFQINDHLRTENHKLIIEEVRKLLGSIAVLADHSQKLGSNIQSLVNNYDKFSGSFNRNFLPKARNIQSLGVDVGKDAIKPLERFKEEE